MNTYFNIHYEFDQAEVLHRIDEQIHGGEAGYVCVADSNVLQVVHNDLDYREVVNGSMFSICDSSWLPLFLKRIYGVQYQQYYGSQIFEDLIKLRRYRQLFIGASQAVLESLRERLCKIDSAIMQMKFYDPPYCEVEDFDYAAIAEMVNADNPDIIWVALGAPKQEVFMHHLRPFLKRGVMIGVGAVFNFYCNLENVPKRAPQWMIDHHLEFAYRLFIEPKKQFMRCKQIIESFPSIYREERKKRKA